MTLRLGLGAALSHKGATRMGYLRNIMMNKMVVANLVHRPTRSLIAMSAIALEVTHDSAGGGAVLRILNGSRESQVGVGADLMVMPPGSSGWSGMSGAPISVKVGDVLREMPHVNVAAPVIWAFSQKPLEIDLRHRSGKIRHSFHLNFATFPGGPFQGPNDVIVDDYFAGMNHKKVGDTIEMLNHPFRICGIVPHGKGGRKFLPLATMQDLIGAEGRASVFYVKLDNPANIDDGYESDQGESRDGAVCGALDGGVSVDDDSGQSARDLISPSKSSLGLPWWWASW